MRNFTITKTCLVFDTLGEYQRVQVSLREQNPDEWDAYLLDELTLIPSDLREDIQYLFDGFKINTIFDLTNKKL